MVVLLVIFLIISALLAVVSRFLIAFWPLTLLIAFILALAWVAEKSGG